MLQSNCLFLQRMSTDQGANIEDREENNEENKTIADLTHESKDEAPVHDTITAPKLENARKLCCGIRVKKNVGHVLTDVPFHLLDVGLLFMYQIVLFGHGC